MVGIVVISHSRALAEGVVEVARAMGVGKAVVEPAGGDLEGGLGTSVDLVEGAVATADDGDGVLLLADLGSSVLTAKMVIEDAGGESLLLADAPLVEGAVAAASMAATGADLAAVHAAAESAYDHRKTR
ncbi:PTS-dependent dihydroxyacetone kinase phosphotransferase subunit DhaM [Actinomadura livida]|uniref:Dihydroxyacetone kinase phosphotransfer subunit n=1 Tax=Actinomadura livida TaxID=79909 RepID=A0A7W7IJ82_9ACTN|nr:MULTISPECIES: phosphoenolpyruvate--protein phosphotransferase [Actinomadura]MBB4778119.1 dihydroxyacetone kinase phosphotransfer subunit [Actinomadura catellatispora]GGU28952.1 PTS fructose transporter subunit IIA [Actinomadura livida]